MYGRCKNCWWYKLTKNPHYTITSSGLKEFPGEGICYNRKKEKMKLEDWIKSCYNKNKHQ